VSHTGVAPEQLASPAHPGRHTNRIGLQMGAAMPQSALLVHEAHWFVANRHLGAFIGQSPSATHWTHRCVAELHLARGGEQSVEVPHSTHWPTPDDVSQTCAVPGQSMFAMHAA
jgi:hypothetical protein